MANPTAYPYKNFLTLLMNNGINPTTDTLHAILLTADYAFDPENQMTYNEINDWEITETQGYTAGGLPLTGVTVSINGGGQVVLGCNAPVWNPPNTIAAKYCAIYDYTNPNNYLLTCFDFGNQVLPNPGYNSSFTVYLTDIFTFTDSDGLYANGLKAILNNIINPTTDTLKAVLLTNTYTPNYVSDLYYSSISSHEVTGSGYTAGGIALTNIGLSTNNMGQVILTCNDVEWPSPTTISNAAYCAIYDGTNSSNPLISCFPFETLVSSGPTGDSPFIVPLSETGILNLSYIASEA